MLWKLGKTGLTLHILDSSVDISVPQERPPVILPIVVEARQGETRLSHTPRKVVLESVNSWDEVQHYDPALQNPLMN